MKKISLKVAVCLIAGSFLFSSCMVGSWGLFNKYAKWQTHMSDSKFVNAIVGFVLGAVCYPICFLVDSLVLNSIEFWSGTNPALAQNETTIVDGKDARYLVARDATGYAITNLNTNQVTRFNFNAESNSWSLENNGKEVELFTFVDDTHVNILNRDGGYTTVELSQAGVLAYEELIGVNGEAFAQR